MNGDYDIKPVALFVPDLRRDPERKRDPNYRGGDPTYGEDHGYWTEIYGKAISAMGLRYKLLYAGDVVDNNGKVDLSAFSGVIISGGRDADPARYGARRHRKTEPPDGGRDKEIHVVYEAMKQGLPLLGMCRGMQVIAAAASCTITQHLPDYLGKRATSSTTRKRKGSIMALRSSLRILTEPSLLLAPFWYLDGGSGGVLILGERRRSGSSTLFPVSRSPNENLLRVTSLKWSLTRGSRGSRASAACGRTLGTIRGSLSTG
jgi:hypothetical protein